MGVVLIKALEGNEELGRQAHFVEDMPHVLVGDGGKGCLDVYKGQ
jgi:hypothetical protein